MSVEALWITSFANYADAGNGVTVLETDRVYGGDSNFFWTGTYSVAGGVLTASIHVRRHSPGGHSVTGVDDYHLNLEGEANDQRMLLNGTSPDIGLEGTLGVRLVRQAELP